MKLLLDTHTFIWFVEGSKNLSDYTRSLIESPNNQRFLSIASLWEMAIKSSIGKLQLYFDLQVLIEHHIYQNAIEILPINTSALVILQKLPFYHKDPFDRLIISQCLADNLILLSKDEYFSNYSVKCLW